MNKFVDHIEGHGLQCKVEIECEDGSQPSNVNSIVFELDEEECSYEEVIHEEVEEERDEPERKKICARPSEESCPKKRAYLQRYRKEWESIPSYRHWLSESVLGNLYFYCKFCKNDNKCGKTEIEKHMVSKKHIRNSKLPQLRVQKKFSFRGLLCPVFTPIFNKDLINYNTVLAYAKYLAACGIKGVLINDINGEGMNLTVNERMKLVDQWAQACEKANLHLMVQVGGACLKDVQEMARHAENKKVGSIVVLPDLYNRPKDHFDLMRYIKSVTDFATSVPILYHHNPKHTNVKIDMTKFLSEIIGEIDSFVGIIYSDNDLGQALCALEVNPDKFTIFLGTDEIILAAATSGFSSLVATTLNFLPKLVQTICNGLKNGNIKEARKAQSALRSILDTVGRHGDKLPVMKTIMNILTPINVGSVREPLVGLWQDKTNKMRGELQDLGVGAWMSTL